LLAFIFIQLGRPKPIHEHVYQKSVLGASCTNYGANLLPAFSTLAI
jgi:hypothetical protein